MKWKVLFFETKRGKSPVEEFINKQQPQARAKTLHLLELLLVYGSQLSMPHAKTLGSGIYELRVRGKEELRIFYCFRRQNIYLLHAFKKKTQKTPQKELTIAIERFKQFDTV